MAKDAIYKTKGIIIKKADLGEVDRLFTIYTQNYGKLHLRAKSVRKNESKLKGFLELFTYGEFFIARSKTIDIITDVNPLDVFPSLHVSLASLGQAYYASEILDKLISGQERDELLWHLILDYFQKLDTAGEVSDFESRLLILLGYRLPANQPPVEYIQTLINERINSARSSWLTV